MLSKNNKFNVLLILFVLVVSKITAQENSEIISGNIYNLNKMVPNVHIINLNTKMGTISNVNGEFEISVSKNDVLLISSIQYNPLKISISERILNNKKLNITLNAIVNKLQEVFLNGLTGDLNYDIKNKPKDTLPNHSFVFNKSDVYKIKPDYSTDFSKAPDAEVLTNPILMNGVGASVAIPDKSIERALKLKRELKKKKNFPYKLKKEFGLDFFINDLKIPEDKINNFITYCEYRNIYTKYYNNRVLEVIKTLQEESKIYNEIKN